jgi:uncharacterized protein (DUF2384 family)
MSKKTEKAPKKSKRVKQGELPGMEKKHVKEVEEAGEAYEQTRDARMKLTEDESEKLTSLVEVMEKHKLTVYRNDEAVPPMLITLKAGKTRARVERIKDGAE